MDILALQPKFWRLLAQTKKTWSGDADQIFFRWLLYTLCMFYIYIYIYIYIYTYIYILFETYYIKDSPWWGGMEHPPPSCLEKLQKSLSQPRPRSYWPIKKSTRGGYLFYQKSVPAPKQENYKWLAPHFLEK